MLPLFASCVRVGVRGGEVRSQVVAPRLGAHIALLAASLLAGPVFAEDPLPPAAGDGATVDFARDIAPLFQARCIRCHQPAIKKGELSLATSDDLTASEYVVPGKSGESHLLEVIASVAGAKPQMPKEGLHLTDSEVALVRRWIDEGARWPKGLVIQEKSKADESWWSLQPLAKSDPPSPAGAPAEWSSSPIDRFVYDRLAASNLKPNPPADRRALIRRVTYDLTGLPPTPEEVAAFVADSAPDAYEKLVDRLLASPHYGEHWGRHWLDVVRFGESSGFEQNFLIDTIWPFRDYVIRSFNDDKPFDRLIVEHLAGDSVAAGDPNVEVGLTFLVCGPFDSVGNQDAVQAAQIRANTIDEMIRTTSEAFLGLTVGCARCHNHKFDPISQRDYYRMYATFAGVFHDDRVVATDNERHESELRLAPFVVERDRLVNERTGLENAIVARAGSEFDPRWTRPAVVRTGVDEAFEPVQARFVRLIVEGSDVNPAARSGYRIDEFEIWTADAEPRNVALASAAGKARGSSSMPGDFSEAYAAGLVIDGKFGERWSATGPELVIELPQAETIRRVYFSSDRMGTLGQHGAVTFVSDYRLEVSLDGEDWTPVANSHDRQPINDAHRRKRIVDLGATEAERQQMLALSEKLALVEGQIAGVPTLPSLRVGRLEQPPAPLHVFVRGDPQQKGEAVVPASLDVLGKATPGYELTDSATERDRRQALANWIVASDNPLAPRVLINRLWYYHFGAGIVDTPSDLGFMGGRPTHPELLDWLARQLLESGWRLKPLHRMIVLSQTYRQSTTFREDAALVDADSRLLWRFPPRRLSGEEIRDTMLSIAGKLDARAGGPGFRLYRYLRDNVSTYVPLDEVGPETYRRAVYHQNARASRIDVVTDFDGPDCAFPAPRRVGTTTPLQALTMMNHRFTLDMAGILAERVLRDAKDGANTAHARKAFELAFSREATDDEIAAAVQLIERHGLRAFCRALLNSNEFIYLN